MTENSTFLFIMDGPEGESEIINVDELLDPWGAYSKELENAFRNFDFSPSQESINNILMKA